MKIAIPTRNKQVDDHFGHCDAYTIFSVNDSKTIDSEENYEAPRGCGCKSNIAGILREKGVEVLLAGNMGQGAVNKVSEAGIKVVRGCSGNVRILAEAYLKNQITDSGEICHQHSHEGDHDHSHECLH